MSAEPNRRPDFFLAGAAKSGTTSLARYLGEHPGLFLTTPKEPNFFAFPEDARPECLGPIDPERLYEVLLKYSVTSRSEYEALFADAPAQSVRGEASVRYLYEPTTPGRIADYDPEAKLLVLLRDPIERLHSHYHMNLKIGVEPLSLPAALDAEDERVGAGWGWDWHYRRVGRYGEQLERYFQHFSDEQVLVLFHRDLSENPQAVYQEACGFLGVDPSEGAPDFAHRSLVGATPRRRWLQNLMWEDSPVKAFARRLIPAGMRQRVTRRINESNRTRVPPVDDRLREALAPDFAEDREKLENLLGREAPW